VTHEGQIYDYNSKFSQFWGLYSHISAPINAKFGTGERIFGLLPRAKFHVYRGNVSPLRGEKPILDYWVKTIPAWVRFAQAAGNKVLS